MNNIYIDNNPKKCFENGIDLTIFNDDNISNFMYMHSKGKHDYFKDKLTRCYISIERQQGFKGLKN